MKHKKTFEGYKEKLRELHEELLLALREKDDETKDRIIKEEKAVKREFERKFGKFAQYRRAPIHESHNMGEWGNQVLAPVGTLRFYVVRRCLFCDAGEAHHAAGHFVDNELYHPCKK